MFIFFPEASYSMFRQSNDLCKWVVAIPPPLPHPSLIRRSPVLSGNHALSPCLSLYSWNCLLQTRMGCLPLGIPPQDASFPRCLWHSGTDLNLDFTWFDWTFPLCLHPTSLLLLVLLIKSETVHARVCFYSIKKVTKIRIKRISANLTVLDKCTESDFFSCFFYSVSLLNKHASFLFFSPLSIKCTTSAPLTWKHA